MNIQGCGGGINCFRHYWEFSFWALSLWIVDVLAPKEWLLFLIIGFSKRSIVTCSWSLPGSIPIKSIRWCMHAAEIANKLKHINNNTNLEFFSIDFYQLTHHAWLPPYAMPCTTITKHCTAENDHMNTQFLKPISSTTTALYVHCNEYEKILFFWLFWQ